MEFLIDNFDKKPHDELKSTVLLEYLWFPTAILLLLPKNPTSIAKNPAKHDKFAVLFLKTLEWQGILVLTFLD